MSWLRKPSQAGLLTSESLVALLKREVRQRRINNLFAAIDRLDPKNIDILDIDEIAAEIAAARVERAPTCIPLHSRRRKLATTTYSPILSDRFRLICKTADENRRLRQRKSYPTPRCMIAASLRLTSQLYAATAYPVVYSAGRQIDRAPSTPQWRLDTCSNPRRMLNTSNKLRKRLERLLSEYQAGDRFAPVTVVVPTTYAGLYLRRDIGRRGLVNVRFMPLARVAELLGAPSLAANGQRPLKPPIEFAAVRRAAGEAAGELEPFRAHPSFHASLRSTFRDLRRAAPDAITALERRRGMSSEIARLYARYCEHTKAYYDREALAEAAAAAVSSGHADTALTALGPVIAYLPRTLTPSEQRLFDALRDAWRCATILAATGDEEADEILLPAAAPSASSMPPPRPAHLLVTSDTGEEVRSVVRSNRRRRARGHALPSDGDPVLAPGDVCRAHRRAACRREHSHRRSINGKAGRDPGRAHAQRHRRSRRQRPAQGGSDALAHILPDQVPIGRIQPLALGPNFARSGRRCRDRAVARPPGTLCDAPAAHGQKPERRAI